MGRAVPRDVSLASFDDSVIAGLINPSITAMTRDTFELGEQAATLLLQQIEAGTTLPSVQGPTPCSPPARAPRHRPLRPRLPAPTPGYRRAHPGVSTTTRGLGVRRRC